MAGTDTRIEPMTVSDLAQVPAGHDRFRDGRDARFQHQRELTEEPGDTCLTPRAADDRIDSYPLESTTPRRAGYIHAVAVRCKARGTRVRAGPVRIRTVA